MSPWQPGNNGAGRRIWFLHRGDGAPLTDRYHRASNGRLIRYASYQTAQRAAEKLNQEVER